MPSENPFLLFSWKRPFLPDFKSYLMDMTAGKPGSALLLVPNKRPWRYFVELFKKEGRAIALPKMLPFSEIASLWRANASGMPGYVANTLDQVALLRQCALDVAEGDPLLARQFADMEMAEFLPWGMRLSALLEELFQHGKTGQDIPYSEDDVPEPAARLLAALGRIGARWRALLEEKGWTTAGFDNFIACRSARSVPELLRPRPGRPVFIMGFSALNGTQNAIFRQLWESGAQVCLHGDFRLATGKSFHPACKPLAEWARAWHAGIVPAFNVADDYSEPEYRFYAAYDSHSQLVRMAEDLGGTDPAVSRAIILPASDMLMPVLHELPDKEVNISMGYPLGRAPLARLLDIVFRPPARGGADGRMYWRDLLQIFNLPFLGMLDADAEGADHSFRDVLAGIEAKVRSGAKYVDPGALVDEAQMSLPDSSAKLLRQCFRAFVEKPAKISTTAELAEALRHICGLFRQYGSGLLHSFPLDAEAMARLEESVIPTLEYNEMSGERLSRETLYVILAALLKGERIAFEADPLVGIQILGMLETRLLQFDHLFIMDASDDLFPGSRPQDPLLPDALRPLLGLPDAASRHAVVGYNLFRLCSCARNVNFYWAEGVIPSPSGTSKKFRSRFVEQLIWKIESERNSLLSAGSQPLESAISDARLNIGKPAPMRRQPALDAAVCRILDGSLSASLLESYISCPLGFALGNVLRLKGPVEVNEGDDPQLIGICAHNALEEFFLRYKGTVLEQPERHIGELLECLENQSSKAGLAARLPPASYMAFQLAAPARFAKFLSNHPAESIIVDCEKRERTVLRLGGREYLFTARFDRIDERPDGLHILDYKTGTPQKCDPGLWTDGAFFASLCNYMDNHQEFDEEGDGLLAELAGRMPDPQLPLYMLVAREIFGEAPVEVAFIDLKNDGVEVGLFSGIGAEEREKALENCRIAIAFVLRHMEKARIFMPAFDDGACRWCAMRAACGIGGSEK